MHILRFGILLLCMLSFGVDLSLGQTVKAMKWYDPSTEKGHIIHNQLWDGSEIHSFYDRLPAKAEQNVRKEVWNLSENAAGLKLVFQTDAEEVIVRYTTASKNSYAMHHFPATGVSGVDLYVSNMDGSWAWANSKYDFKDTVTYSYSGLDLDRKKYKDGRFFHLYLPLYNKVEWLEIGVPNGRSLRFIPVSTEKPIVVYGTSIAQGGCASRPGMAWTNILERNIAIPVVNLGFSGNGRLEKGLIDLIAEKDAGIFVLDCLPNLELQVDHISAKIQYAVNKIRSVHADTPIILVEHSAYMENNMNASRSAEIKRLNEMSFRAYQELRSKGVRKLFYLTHEDIGLDMNDSVDGLHPTDMGMVKYAKAYEKVIKTIKK